MISGHPGIIRKIQIMYKMKTTIYINPHLPFTFNIDDKTNIS